MDDLQLVKTTPSISLPYYPEKNYKVDMVLEEDGKNIDDSEVSSGIVSASVGMKDFADFHAITFASQTFPHKSEREFLSFVRKTIADYANAHLGKNDGETIAPDDVYIVWLCKTLQNHKALASTPLHDGMYYEITYNGDKQEAYIDAYKKWENFVVKC